MHPRSVHLPILVADSVAPWAPCLCESVGATTPEELGEEPRLIGLVSPASVVHTLWSKIAPDARSAFDLIDTDGCAALLQCLFIIYRKASSAAHGHPLTRSRASCCKCQFGSN